MEFTLLLGRQKITGAMKIGRARHAELEEEVCVYIYFILCLEKNHCQQPNNNTCHETRNTNSIVGGKVLEKKVFI